MPTLRRRSFYWLATGYDLDLLLIDPRVVGLPAALAFSILLCFDDRATTITILALSTSDLSSKEISLAIDALCLIRADDHTCPFLCGL